MKSSGVPTDEQLKQMFPTDKYPAAYSKLGIELYKANKITVKEDLFLQTLRTLDLYLDNFIGKKMELSGFVYRENDLPDRQFILGRFVVTCCSADATPYGVLIEYDHTKTLSNDACLKITGSIDKTKNGDKDVLVLKAEKLEEIPAPKTQSYIYPNADFR